jgi:nitrogen fixation/metabolism regulation signal transduction histidine kinase
MEAAKMSRQRVRWSSYGLAVLWAAIGAGALLTLAKSVQNSGEFSRLQPWILLTNLIGVMVLTVLLGRKVWQLVRDYRHHVPGSRLAARTVAIFGALVIAPLLIVYLFSLDFLNRGIDSWFKVEVKQGLNDALELSRSALEVRMREYSWRTERFAQTLGNLPGSEVLNRLDYERRATDALEMAVFDGHQHVLAVASDGIKAGVVPARPADDVVRQVSQGQPYASLDPQADGQYLIRVAAPVTSLLPSPDYRYVYAVYGVPRQLGALSEAVQRAYSQYGELAVLREPLKSSFELTLTLVLLIAMLAAIHGAIFSAQRLTRPVQDLIAGTRAVGKGDFGTRLPLPSRDEMGFLVHSFNDMTKRLRRAREEARRSSEAVEHERERLAIILARLSTGVLAVDRTLTVHIANQAAGLILGVNLSAANGRSLSDLARGNERFSQFVAALVVRFAAGREEWREQIDLDGPSGHRALMCACTPLPASGAAPTESAEVEPRPGEAEASMSAGMDRGYVIVFDDITALLQAQRDAAWGEVARRLAHEIKNPLTPIQLSAERMRRRFLASMARDDAEMLQRSTDTIVQQVETMKQMVNAFSEYARAPDMKIARFDLNGLASEVADLYRSQDSRIEIRLDLASTAPIIEADRGRVRQILNNLLVNALEALESLQHSAALRGGASPAAIGGAAASAGGPSWVEIATRLEPSGDAEQAVITVSDNGPGFQRELLARVFDPYVTSKPKGTGLGLAIVKKIVEEHGGRIDADNRPGGGARVRIVLPIENGVRSVLGARELRAGLRKEKLA